MAIGAATHGPLAIFPALVTRAWLAGMEPEKGMRCHPLLLAESGSSEKSCELADDGDIDRSRPVGACCEPRKDCIELAFCLTQVRLLVSMQSVVVVDAFAAS